MGEAHRLLRPGGRAFASSPDAQRWVWDDYTHRRPFTRKSLPEAVRGPGLRRRAGGLRVGDAGDRDRVRAGRGASAVRGRWRRWRGYRSCAGTSGCWRGDEHPPAPAGGARPRAPDERLAPAPLAPPRRRLRGRGSPHSSQLVRHRRRSASRRSRRGRCATCCRPAPRGHTLVAHPGRPLPAASQGVRAARTSSTPRTSASGTRCRPRKHKAELGYRLVLTAWETIPFLDAYRNARTRPYRRRVLAGTDLFLAATERARLALLMEGAAASADPGRAPRAWTTSCSRPPSPAPPQRGAPDRLRRPPRVGEGPPGRPARRGRAARRGIVEGQPRHGC